MVSFESCIFATFRLPSRAFWSTSCFLAGTLPRRKTQLAFFVWETFNNLVVNLQSFCNTQHQVAKLRHTAYLCFDRLPSILTFHNISFLMPFKQRPPTYTLNLELNGINLGQALCNIICKSSKNQEILVFLVQLHHCYQNIDVRCHFDLQSQVSCSHSWNQGQIPYFISQHRLSNAWWILLLLERWTKKFASKQARKDSHLILWFSSLNLSSPEPTKVEMITCSGQITTSKCIGESSFLVSLGFRKIKTHSRP